MRRAPTGRGVLALALALCLLIAPAAWAKGSFRFKQVDCTNTVSHVVTTLDTRTALTIQNVGTINAYLGSGPIDIASAQGSGGGYIGFTLHAGSVIEWGGSRAGGDPTVGVRCQADGSVRLQVIEEF